MRGRTISIFIPDSNPRSVKICDIKDSIVKAIFIPRNKVVKNNSEDQVARFFLNKASRYTHEGVPDDWTGVEEMLIK